MRSFLLARLDLMEVEEVDLMASPAQDTLSHISMRAALKQFHIAPTLFPPGKSLPARLPQGQQSTTSFAPISPFGREKPALGIISTDVQETDLVSARRCGVTAVTAAARSNQLKEEIVEET